MATDLERLVVQLSADFKAFERGLARAQGVSNRQFAAIEKRAQQMNSRLNSIGSSAAHGLIAPLSGIGAALGTREIAAYADAWTEAGNKMRASAEIAGVHTRSLNMLKDGANEARTDLSAYVDLYAKLIRSASNVAKSEQEVATATEVVTKAFKAGGASTQEQIAGIIQLSQALGSGVLQGDELRSLRENAPLVAQAIANEFKTTIAGLKDLGAEGKITSDRVFKAILAAQKPIQAAFEATNATIKDSITRLNNEFTAYIGNADESAGASRKLVEALQFLSENFEGVADTVVQFATVVISALTGRAILGMVAGMGNAVTALGTFITALRTGTLAAAGFTAALGPIGLLAGAAAAAIYLLYDAQNATESAASNFNIAIGENEKALNSSTNATYAQISALRELIAMQAQAARAAATAADGELEAAESRAKQFRLMTGRKFDPFELAASEAQYRADTLGYAAGHLEEQLAKVDEQLKTTPSGYGRGTGAAADSGGKTGKYKKTAEDRFNDDLQRVRDRTAALAEEARITGLTYVEQERRRMALDLEQSALEHLREEARRKGVTDLESIKLSSDQVAAIDAVSSAYAQQADALRRVEDAQHRAESAAQEFYDTFKSGMIGAITGAESFQDALSGILSRLSEMVLNSAFDALTRGATDSGGWLTGLFKGFSGGGYTGPGGKNVPAGVVHKGEVVFSQADVRRHGGVGAVEAMRRGLRGYAGGGPVDLTAMPQMPTMPRLQSPANQSGPSVTFAPVIDARGADQAAVDRLETVMAKSEREFEARVITTIRSANRRNVKLR